MWTALVGQSLPFKLRCQIMVHGAVHGAETFADTKARLHSKRAVHSPADPLTLFTAMINCLLCSRTYHQFHSHYICQHQGLKLFIREQQWMKRDTMKSAIRPHVPFQILRQPNHFFWVSDLFTCAVPYVVICGGEATTTIHLFIFFNDLVSNRQHELPGEQLVCILIGPGNHLSEAMTAFLILHLTGSLLLLLFLLLWISHLYICSVCIKCLYQHEQTSMEDMQNASCIGPQWL